MEAIWIASAYASAAIGFGIAFLCGARTERAIAVGFWTFVAAVSLPVVALLVLATINDPTIWVGFVVPAAAILVLPILVQRIRGAVHSRSR